MVKHRLRVMKSTECLLSVSVSLGDRSSIAGSALLDTGADNFVRASFISTLDPSRSLFFYNPSVTTLGDDREVRSDHTVFLYLQLEPLLDNNPLGSAQPYICLRAIVAKDLSNDVIIGNQSIHDWFLYPYIYQANRSATKNLKIMLSRKIDKDDDMISIDTVSVVDPSFLPMIDYPDSEVDDYPPETFPISIADAKTLPSSESPYPSDDENSVFSDISLPDMGTIQLTSNISKQRHPHSHAAGVKLKKTVDDRSTAIGPAGEPRVEGSTAFIPRQVADNGSDFSDVDPMDVQYDCDSVADTFSDRPPVLDTSLRTAKTSNRIYVDSSTYVEDVDEDSEDDISDVSDTSYQNDDDSDTDDNDDEASASSDDDEQSVQSWQTDDFSVEGPAEVDTAFEDTVIPNIYPHLSESSYQRLVKVLSRYRNLFSDKTRTGGAKVPEMDIKMKPNAEIPRALRSRPRLMATIISEEAYANVEKLLLLDIIEPYPKAKYWSQVLMVKHPSGKKRFCIDYRYINLITDTYSWPLPLIDSLIRSLGGKAVFSTLDLTMGFHQCKLSRRARRLTAFITPQGIFRYKRVPFGLSGGPSYFQSIVQNVVLKGLVGKACLVYIDDVIIFGKDEAEHLANLEKVLQRFKEFDITIKPAKCFFHHPEVKFLGHGVNKDGIKITDERKEHIGNMRRPETVSELHSFVGLVNFFRDYTYQFAHISSPLYGILSNRKYKPKTRIPWSELPEAAAAFELLRDSVANAPILHFLKDDGDIHLYTDASDQALGGHLVQVIKGKPYTICFLSKKFAAVQQRWSTTDKELFAIVYCVLKLRAMLGGRRFTVFTDHKTLTHWYSINDTPKVCRWKQRLTEFTFDIKHIDGLKNNVADALSRLCAGTTRFNSKRASTNGSNPETQPKREVSTASINKPPSPRVSKLRKAFKGAKSTKDLMVKTLLAIEKRKRAEAKQLKVKLRVRTSSSEQPAAESFSHELTPDERIGVIQAHHSDTVGHSGIRSTESRIRDSGYKWPKMHRDIKRFVEQCHACQVCNPDTHPSRGHVFTVKQGVPFMTVQVDTMYSLTGDPRFSYILVFIDCMSRLVRLYPLITMEAKEFLFHLRTYVNQFRPASLAFDNHRQWVNEEVKNYLVDESIVEIPAASYSKQQQSLVERAIESVRLHFEKWQVSNPNKPWSSHLSVVERIINDTPIPDSSNRVKPNELLFGTTHAKRLHQFESPQDRIEHLNDFQEQVIGDINERIASIQQDKTNANLEKQLPQFSPGSPVLIKNHAKRKTFDSPRFLGPFTVIMQEDNIVTVADLVNSGIKRSYHIRNIKQYKPSPQFNLDHVRKSGTYIVESIVGHRHSSRGGFIFTVKWQDYEETSEEYLSKNPSIRRTEAFVLYCQDKPELQHLAQNVQVFTPFSQ